MEICLIHPSNQKLLMSPNFYFALHRSCPRRTQAIQSNLSALFCVSLFRYCHLCPPVAAFRQSQFNFLRRWGVVTYSRRARRSITLQMHKKPVPGDSYLLHIINLSKYFYSSHYPACLQDKKLRTIAHCQFMKQLFHLPSPKTKYLIKEIKINYGIRTRCYHGYPPN